MSRLPAFFIPHGGGPCFFMDWKMGPANTWDNLADWLKNMHTAMPEQPKAIVVISAHWETAEVRITAKANPDLYFDYYGFPEHTYQLTYPAPGAPELAQQIQGLFQQAHIPSHLDSERDYDHGVFIPFKLIYPDATIPIVQVSLLQSLDPAKHVEIGKALAPLRDQGVLIVGSGMSFHNLRVFGQNVMTQSMDFDQWLTKTVADPATRDHELSHWADAPYGKFCHPREEHLIPLMVIAGTSDQPGQQVFSDQIMGSVISAYQFN